MIDYSAVRAELRTLSRGNLLVIAERAAELIPAAQLSALVGDIVNLGATALTPVPGLVNDTRQFVDVATHLQLVLFGPRQTIQIWSGMGVPCGVKCAPSLAPKAHSERHVTFLIDM